MQPLLTAFENLFGVPLFVLYWISGLQSLDMLPAFCELIRLRFLF